MNLMTRLVGPVGRICMPEPGKIYRGRTSRRRAKTGPDANDVARNYGQLVVECSRPSLLENPYRIPEDGNPEQVVAKFRTFVRALMKFRANVSEDHRNGRIITRLEELRREHLAGKEILLLCYCSEKDQCHTEVIAQYIREGNLDADG